MLVFSEEAFAQHLVPEGHPERPERMAAVAHGLAGLLAERREAPVAAESELLRCHPAAYVARLKAAVPAERLRAVDGDTWLSPGSWEAAMRAVGGACAAVDAVLGGEARAAFLAARPPGHHAEADRAMGFCLFGTVAIAAKRALDHHGLSRVAVLDFDVHHGNGTQDLLWDEARVRLVSSHQMPLFPGTGSEEERGAHRQVTNLPLRPGSDGRAMWAAWAPGLERLKDWRPELILISAGFDAHIDDPLGGLGWTTADFARLTRAIMDLAAGSGAGVVSCLEGGYDLSALADTVRAHVSELSRTMR
ncbi:histone deacetylase family protein [Pseudogemmobacter bohemicus]|uniref:histone deacetylase family protein n=1 Tax=Pseudogemmobacter bohemicus TaxID=2250708 RepID=UPI000DD373C9|nr:histone deacetylase family protein [Pseudogemmobacter bohemicus]